MDQADPLRQGAGGPEERRLPPASQGAVIDRVFRATLVLATAVALLFLLLPIAAIFLRVPPGDLISALGTDAARDALIVTAETNAVAMLLIILFGTPTAYWVATRTSRSRDLVVTLIELPLVLPPAVAGIGLLAAFGRLGLLGGTFEALGIDIAFTRSPSSSRSRSSRARSTSARPSRRSRRSTRRCPQPPARSEPARDASSSASRCRSPPAGSAPAPRSRSHAGSASSAPRSCSPARSQGVTQTLSLAIYEQFDVDFNVALAISAVLVIISAVTLLSVKLLTRWRSASTSPIPFAASTRPSS